MARALATEPVGQMEEAAVAAAETKGGPVVREAQGVQAA